MASSSMMGGLKRMGKVVSSELAGAAGEALGNIAKKYARPKTAQTGKQSQLKLLLPAKGRAKRIGKRIATK